MTIRLLSTTFSQVVRWQTNNYIFYDFFLQKIASLYKSIRYIIIICISTSASQIHCKQHALALFYLRYLFNSFHKSAVSSCYCQTYTNNYIIFECKLNLHGRPTIIAAYIYTTIIYMFSFRVLQQKLLYVDIRYDKIKWSLGLVSCKMTNQ